MNLRDAMTYDAGRAAGMLEAAAVLEKLSRDYQQQAVSVDLGSGGDFSMKAAFLLALAELLREKAGKE